MRDQEIWAVSWWPAWPPQGVGVHWGWEMSPRALPCHVPAKSHLQAQSTLGCNWGAELGAEPRQPDLQEPLKSVNKDAERVCVLWGASMAGGMPLWPL